MNTFPDGVVRVPSISSEDGGGMENYSAFSSQYSFVRQAEVLQMERWQGIQFSERRILTVS